MIEVFKSTFYGACTPLFSAGEIILIEPNELSAKEEDNTECFILIGSPSPLSAYRRDGAKLFFWSHIIFVWPNRRVQWTGCHKRWA